MNVAHTHHAWLCCANSATDLAERTASYFSGDYEYLDLAPDRCDIATVRELRTRLQSKPVATDGVLVRLFARAINHEAQTALLKELEDPRPQVRVVIGVPVPEALLPTLRSRLDELTPSTDIDAPTVTVLSAVLSEQLDAIARAAKAKDTAALEELYGTLRQQAVGGSLSAKRAVLFVDTYWQFPGASRKMLLEHLALSLPSGHRG